MNPSRAINILIPANSLKYSDVKAGVYKLIHRKTGKVYVGSTGDIYKRMTTHALHLLNGSHPNKNIQACFDDSREFDLVFDEVGRNEKSLRYSEEQKLLDELLPTGVLLNIAMDVIAPWKRRKMHEATKAALLKAITGRIKTKEEIEKIRAGHLGVKKPPGFSEKLRLIAKNRPPRSQESIEKTRISSTGRRHSKESIEKMQSKQAKVPVIINGVEYMSCGHAARSLGLTIPTVRGRVLSESPMYSNYLPVEKRKTFLTAAHLNNTL